MSFSFIHSFTHSSLSHFLFLFLLSLSLSLSQSQSQSQSHALSLCLLPFAFAFAFACCGLALGQDTLDLLRSTLWVCGGRAPVSSITPPIKAFSRQAQALPVTHILIPIANAYGLHAQKSLKEKGIKISLLHPFPQFHRKPKNRIQPIRRNLPNGRQLRILSPNSA